MVISFPDRFAYCFRRYAAMAWLSAELDRRGDVAFAGMDTRGKVHANVGSRLLIVAEELNLAVRG